MAKTGFWLRGAQGKLAGASIAKGADGSTVIREVVTPKNPQTTAQKIQRIIMATVVQAYSKMSAICDHSYEGLPTGAKCMNRFNQLNANMLRRWVSERVAAGDTAYDILDFCPSGEQRLADNPWIISSGSLPQVVTDVDQNAQYAAFALPVNTYQGVCDYYSLQRGDQLTLITVEEEAYPNISGSFHFARIILDPMDGQGNQLPMSTQFVGESGIVSPSLRNETEDLTISYVNSTVQFLHDTDYRNVLLGGVIVSRKENDKWRRSACTLSTGQSSSNGVSLGYCIDNFGATDVPTTSPNFLNNSGQHAPMNPGSGGGSTSSHTLTFNQITNERSASYGLLLGMDAENKKILVTRGSYVGGELTYGVPLKQGDDSPVILTSVDIASFSEFLGNGYEIVEVADSDAIAAYYGGDVFAPSMRGKTISGVRFCTDGGGNIPVGSNGTVTTAVMIDDSGEEEINTLVDLSAAQITAINASNVAFIKVVSDKTGATNAVLATELGDYFDPAITVTPAN